MLSFKRVLTEAFLTSIRTLIQLTVPATAKVKRSVQYLETDENSNVNSTPGTPK